MTQDDVTRAVLAMPEVRQLAVPKKEGGLGWLLDDIKKRLDDLHDKALVEVVTAYEWDFALRKTNTVTVAAQDEYTLTGAADDAYRIHSIRYTSAKTLLTRKAVATMDEIESRRDITAVSYWTPLGMADGFPVVRLIGTPADAGVPIHYRYWRNDISLEELPESLYDIMVITLAKRIVGSLRTEWPQALARAINAYEPSDGGTNVVMQDPEVVAMNNRVSNLHGWS